MSGPTALEDSSQSGGRKPEQSSGKEAAGHTASAVRKQGWETWGLGVERQNRMLMLTSPHLRADAAGRQVDLPSLVNRF